MSYIHTICGRRKKILSAIGRRKKILCSWLRKVTFRNFFFECMVLARDVSVSTSEWCKILVRTCSNTFSTQISVDRTEIKRKKFAKFGRKSELIGEKWKKMEIFGNEVQPKSANTFPEIPWRACLDFMFNYPGKL